MRRRSLVRALVIALVAVLTVTVTALLLTNDRADQGFGPAQPPVPQAIPGGFEDDPVAAGWALTPVLGHAESSICWGSEMIRDHGPQELLR